MSRSHTDSAGAVVSRVIAAIVGGYVLANLCSIVLSYLLPGTRANAVGIALMASFLIYVCAVLWVFAAQTAWRGWLGLLLPCLLCSLVIWQLVPEDLL